MSFKVRKAFLQSLKSLSDDEEIYNALGISKEQYNKHKNRRRIVRACDKCGTGKTCESY